MKKKNYMKPCVNVHQLHASKIMAGSLAAKQSYKQYEEVDNNYGVDWK